MQNSGIYKQTNCEDCLDPESHIPFEPSIRPPLRSIDKFAEPRMPYLSCRYTVVVMTFLGFFVLLGTRCNIGMSKVYFESLFSKSQLELNWNLANNIEPFSLWSFLIAQISGGLLAYKFPANKVFGLGIVSSAILNLFLPFTYEYQWIIKPIYCMQGFAQGITFPAVFGIWRFWAPPLERSKMATIAFSGAFAGMLLGIPICGFLINWIHWRAMFFFFSILGLVWFGFWYWLVFEKPRAHPAISEHELMHIEQSIGASSKLSMPSVPWTKILTSLPVYAVIVASICQMWGYFLLAYYQFTFFKLKFHFMVNDSGLIAALPYLMMTIIIPIGGFWTDFLRQRKTLTTTNSRKIFTCVSFVLQGLCFLYIPYATTAPKALIAILICIALSGFAVSGYIVNYLDIAPRFASILISVSITAGFLAGIFCPLVSSWLITYQKEEIAWNLVFSIPACLLIAAAGLYGIFSSGELQSWEEPKRDEQKSMSEVREGN